MMEESKSLIQNNLKQFEKEYRQKALFTAVAPGRINIIGEHTDYNEGLAMPAAINRWVAVSFSPEDNHNVNIKSLYFNSKLNFKIGERPQLTENWQKYVFGTIAEFNAVFPVLKGFNAVITGNVPIQSGVSSSAALEVAMMNGLRYFYRADFSDITLIKLCQKTEHDYLKVESGLLDQYASQFSKKGKIMLLDFKTLTHQYINADISDCLWVLVNSKVKRELAKSKYTERVRETRMAFRHLQESGIKLDHFREIKEEHLSFIRNDTWRKRLRHYVSENQRVLRSKEHLHSGNFEALGRELISSHYSLKNDYEVSCRELDFLVTAAINFSGCYGSRMMGGGFGGSTINLVNKNALTDFGNYISEQYHSEFAILPEVAGYILVNGAEIYSQGM